MTELQLKAANTIPSRFTLKRLKMEIIDDKGALFEALSLERIESKETLEQYIQKNQNVSCKDEIRHLPKDEVYHCKQSVETSPEKSALLRHMNVHTNEKTHQCSFCDKVFSRKDGLKRHTMTHSGENVHINENTYQCTFCDKSFTQKSALKRHITTHTGEKTYKCTQCNKAYARKEYLTNHLRIHTGEKPFICKHCGKDFVRKSSLRKHENIHTREKLHLCSHCGKAFSSKSYLIKHIRVHSGEKNKLYPCVHCDKTLSSNKSLMYHMETHSEEKPYECNECNRSFSCKGNLLIHMKNHEKTFQCTICGKMLKSNYHLTCHMRKHTGERPYQCTQCDKNFTTKTILTEHMKSHGEKPYQCTQCGKAFLIERDLIRHIVTHTTKKRKCIHPDCDEGFHFRKDLIEHLKLKHDIDTKVTQLSFSSWQEFLSWKENEEKHSLTYFSKQTATKILKNGSYSYFHCQRDGHANPHRKKGEEQPKSARKNKKGVVKKGMTCPSKIICKVDVEGAVSVKYIQSHFHPLQLEDTEHHPTQKRILDQIREKLISGASVGHIYNELQEGTDLSNNDADEADNTPQHKRSITKRQIHDMKYKLKKKGLIISDNTSTVIKGKNKSKDKRNKKNKSEGPVNYQTELTSHGTVVINVDSGLSHIYEINSSANIINNPSNIYQTETIQENDYTNATTLIQDNSGNNSTNNHHNFYQSYQDHINGISAVEGQYDSDSSTNETFSLCEPQIAEKRDQDNVTIVSQERNKSKSSNNISLSINNAECTKKNDSDFGHETKNDSLILYHTEIANGSYVEKNKNTLLERALITLDKIANHLKDGNVSSNGLDNICHSLEELNSKCKQLDKLGNVNS